VVVSCLSFLKVNSMQRDTGRCERSEAARIDSLFHESIYATVSTLTSCEKDGEDNRNSYIISLRQFAFVRT